jgi:hypothetical protein
MLVGAGLLLVGALVNAIGIRNAESVKPDATTEQVAQAGA